MMTGKCKSFGKRSLPERMTQNFGVRMPACIRIFFDSALSSVIDSVAGSEPV